MLVVSSCWKARCVALATNAAPLISAPGPSSSLSEEQLLEFRDDVSDALMRACSGVDTVRSLLDDWRATAEFMADETAVTALGEDLENFTAIQRPKDTEA